MVGQATTLCFLLLVAGWATAVVSEEVHQHSSGGYACMRGNPSPCKNACRRDHPGSTGYCKGGSCMCKTAPSGHSS
ncbi:longicornsin-like [Rhipicephalus microplus]|uniref:longicornsin-like n=1 Tax=Rhipicephalus microplus TaxID=6941 RepID=UPI003F6C62C0